jgi:hypothetical protein
MWRRDPLLVRRKLEVRAGYDTSHTGEVLITR